MMRFVCKSKIHRATVTEANLNYFGSLTLDKNLLEAADILPYEQVQVWNLNNGARFETYAMEGEAGSGVVCANGAAARLLSPGDPIIVVAYAALDEKELRQFKPRIVFVDENNQSMKEPPSGSFPEPEKTARLNDDWI